jgi:putative drug exporter of the RND superfamily
LSILVQNLATMLGLGLGIDYALLMVSRFREAIAAGHNGLEASAIAARQAGHTLLISASTVAIGFLALLTVPISEVRSIGVAGFLVAGMSVLLTNTVVPAVLAALGPRINAGRLPFVAKLDPDRAAQTESAGGEWGKVIVAHPWLAIFSPAHPCFCSPRRLRGSIPASPEGIGFRPRRNRFRRFTPWNKWTGPALFTRCA